MVVATVLAAAVGLFALTRSRFFDVDTIEVRGLEHTPAATVDEITGRLIHQPLLEVNVSGAEAEIAALPWVESVRSDRNLDGTVSFAITERTVAAAVTADEGWVLVDGTGRVLDRVDSVPAGVSSVEGVVLEAQPGDQLDELTDRLLPAIEIAAELPPAVRAATSAVRLAGTPDQGILLDLENGGTVVLGEAVDLDQKFVSTATLLDQVPMYCTPTIDVRAPSVPVLTRDPACP
jgi:cell division septal protein FtsQ